jgi:large subunit ribosomal protein L15
MMISDITKTAGRHERRRRVGRGESGGRGKTCGRGHKGCLSRAGGGPHPLSEGGQMPMFRRIPKRGFSNFKFRTDFEVINVAELGRRFASGDRVSIDVLKEAGLVHGRRPRVKVLAKGTLEKQLTVEAHAFSAKARQAIEGAGGTVRVLELLDPVAAARAKRNTAKSSAREAKRTRLENKKDKRAQE